MVREKKTYCVSYTESNCGIKSKTIHSAHGGNKSAAAKQHAHDKAASAIPLLTLHYVRSSFAIVKNDAGCAVCKFIGNERVQSFLSFKLRGPLIWIFTLMPTPNHDNSRCLNAIKN